MPDPTLPASPQPLEAGVPPPPEPTVEPLCQPASPQHTANDLLSESEQPAAPSDAEEEEGEEEDEDESSIFIVEAIVNETKIKGKTHFRIKWEGYPSSENTWEPEENVSPDLIEKWREAQAKKRSKAQKSSPVREASSRRSLTASQPHKSTGSDADESGSSGAPGRDEELLKKFREVWLARHTQSDLCSAISIKPVQLTKWLQGDMGQKALNNIEAKMRAWSDTAAAKLESGDISGMPPIRKSRAQSQAPSDASSSAAGPRTWPKALAKEDGNKLLAGAEDGELEESEESEESEGEGDHQVEKLLREMRQGRRRWLLVKWQELPHDQSTWEPPKHLHEELIRDFDWRKQLPVALSELMDLPPDVFKGPQRDDDHEDGAEATEMAPEVAQWVEMLKQEGLFPASEMAISSSEESSDEEDVDSGKQTATESAQDGTVPGESAGAAKSTDAASTSVSACAPLSQGTSNLVYDPVVEVSMETPLRTAASPSLTSPENAASIASVAHPISTHKQAPSADSTEGCAAKLERCQPEAPRNVDEEKPTGMNSSSNAGRGVHGDSGGGGAVSRRRRRRSRNKFAGPEPFDAECAAALAEECRARGYNPNALMSRLQRTALGMRSCLNLPIATDVQLVTCRASRSATAGKMDTDASGLPAVVIASSREDRVVRIAVPMAWELAAAASEADGCALQPAEAKPDEASAAGSIAHLSYERPLAEFVAIRLEMERKEKFAEEYDSEADAPPLPSSVAPNTEDSKKALAHAIQSDESPTKHAEASGSGMSMDDAALRSRAFAGVVGSSTAPSHPWASALAATLRRFDQAVDFKRLRGVDLAIGASEVASALGRKPSPETSSACSSERCDCPPEVRMALVFSLADRNHICDHPVIVELLDQMANESQRDLPTGKLGVSGTPSALSLANVPVNVGAPNMSTALNAVSPPELLWPNRWGRSARARVSYSKLSESDSQDSDDSSAAEISTNATGRFIPFGSVVGASGASVRVTVATSAGLAASLPVWGVRPRTDAEWAVRALRVSEAVVLREGERALVQAKLEDADGRGMPSRERLKGAVLFAPPPPAIEAAAHKAVVLQRDGALDRAQMGQVPPLMMPKREVTRWFERIAEHSKAVVSRAARKEQAKLKAALEKGDKVDSSVILAPGTRRRAAQQALKAAEDAAADPELAALLEELSEDDSEYEGGSSKAGSAFEASDDDSSDAGYSAGEDEDDGAPLSGASDTDEEGEGGNGSRRRRRSRKAAQASLDAIRVEAEARAVRAASGIAGGADDSDEDDEDYQAPACTQRSRSAENSDDELSSNSDVSASCDSQSRRGMKRPTRRESNVAREKNNDPAFDTFLDHMSSDDESYQGADSDANESDGNGEGSESDGGNTPGQAESVSTQPSQKRRRGRPHGTRRKQRAAANAAGAMPKLAGVPAEVTNALRSALGRDWRFVSPEQVQTVCGAAASAVDARRVHRKIVKAGWVLKVLPHVAQDPPASLIVAAPLPDVVGPSDSEGDATKVKKRPRKSGESSGAAQLDQGRQRNRNTTPSKRWTSEEDQQILALHAEGVPWPKVAKLIGRTVHAVRTHWSIALNPSRRTRGDKSTMVNPAKGAPEENPALNNLNGTSPIVNETARP